jgi:hypothetical protein
MIEQAEAANDIMCFKVIKHCLKVVRNYPSMFIKNPALDYTESDYLYTIWLKVFKSMLGILLIINKS